MNTQSERKKIIAGLIWTYGERFIAQAVTLVITIILARLLSPGEFGTVSAVLIFISIAEAIIIEGFGSALIQNAKADNLDFSSMLYLSFGVSVLLYTLIFFTSPMLVYMYEIENVVSVARVLALRIPLAGINSVQHAYVSRNMEFKRFFFATLIGTILSGIVGVILALNGFGVWALVAQYIINSFMDTLILAFSIGWIPLVAFSGTRVKRMISYTMHLQLVSLLVSIYANTRNFIIGKYYSIEELSYTSKAQQFPAIISTNINTSLSKVLFPAISRHQNDLANVKRITRRSIQLGTYVLAPVLICLAAVSENFVNVLLTNKWMPVAPYLRIMCFVYLLQPIQTASLQAIKAIGESRLYLRLQLLKTFLGVMVLLACLFFFRSTYAIVMSAWIAEIMATVLNCVPNKQKLKYGFREQLKDIAEPTILCSVMYAVIRLLGFILRGGVWLLILQIIIGAIVYLLLSWVYKSANLQYIVLMIRGGE